MNTQFQFGPMGKKIRVSEEFERGDKCPKCGSRETILFETACCGPTYVLFKCNECETILKQDDSEI